MTLGRGKLLFALNGQWFEWG